jgi:hypothetical protein
MVKGMVVVRRNKDAMADETMRESQEIMSSLFQGRMFIGGTRPRRSVALHSRDTGERIMPFCETNPNCMSIQTGFNYLDGNCLELEACEGGFGFVFRKTRMASHHSAMAPRSNLAALLGFWRSNRRCLVWTHWKGR